MKYFNIYNKVIETEFAKIKEKNLTLDEKKKNEWYAMKVAMEFPSGTKSEQFEAFKEYNKGYSFDKFESLLRAVNLNTPGKCRYIAANVKRAAKDFKGFLDGENQATIYMKHYIDNLVERDIEEKRMYFKAKYLFVYLYVFEKEFKSEHLLAILENFLEGFCSKMLSTIFVDVSKSMGFQYKKSTKEVIEKTRKALEFTSQSEDTEGIEDHVKQIETLKFQLENYKNTLDMVQSLFDELKESVEISAIDAKNMAVSEFFSALNSKEFGNILDSMLVVEEVLTNLRKNRSKIPSELVPLTIIFKQFTRFINSYGIEPIDKVNRTFRATYEEVALMNYQGEPFIDDYDVKEVKVTQPGWKYQDVVISLPTVTEV
ncbi:MAG: nucleotide exchange factor GrpE [bacterium]|nr:nucleotide exchange factor GrpE [bacterium]